MDKRGYSPLKKLKMGEYVMLYSKSYHTNVVTIYSDSSGHWRGRGGHWVSAIMSTISSREKVQNGQKYSPSLPAMAGWPQTWKTWNTHGFLWTWKTRGILWILCNSGKNCNKQSIFTSSFKYLCKTAVDWVSRIITTLDEGHYYIYFLLR